jgi:tRNA (guanine37-N1)-methyltransferase
MRIDIVTLFPEIFTAITDFGVTARAHKQGLWALHTHNPRQFATDVHRSVDDRPYGGGPGMVMMAQPLIDAVSAIKQVRGFAPVVLLSPVGRPFDQTRAASLAASKGAIFVCGRYEGVDQRFIDDYVDEQWSLGDFVLSGGEIAALAMLDAAVRLIPGALNHGDSVVQDSFQASLSGMLDSPHYTRPEVLGSTRVPEVLTGGNHALIAKWRRQQSLRLTATARPDLIIAARAGNLLTAADEAFLLSLLSA